MQTRSRSTDRSLANVRPLAVFILSALLAACAPAAAPAPAARAEGLPPVILEVQPRQEVQNGWLVYYYDVRFQDPDGDAEAMAYTVVSSDLPYALHLPETPFEVPAGEQQAGAVYVEATACWQRMDLVYEGRIRDRAGNLSEPATFRLPCPAPVPLDSAPLLRTGLITAGVIGALLALVFWLLFRKRPADRLPAIRSTLLLAMLFMIVQLLWGILHEGGHSLYLLARGVPVTLYAHPFFFSGFSRPLIDNSVWKDLLGSAVALPLSLLISLPFWKRRSLRLLPLVLLLPYSAMGDGFNVMGIMGDFRNLVQVTGLPAPAFLLLGGLIFCAGMAGLFSLLPLAGLDARDDKALFALPAALFLVHVLSLLVAHLVVPGSPIDLAFFAGREILQSASNFIFLYVGIVLAVLCVTLSRRLSPRLPAWLQTGTVALTWRDLRLPALLWAACVVIGLIIIV